MPECPNPYKQAFPGPDQAKLAAKSSSFGAGVYRCECGSWHINGGGTGERLQGVPNRHRQRTSYNSGQSRDDHYAKPVSKDALRVERILSKGSVKPDHQLEHVCKFRPLRATAVDGGVVEVCKGKKCRAYRVVYPESFADDPQ